MWRALRAIFLTQFDAASKSDRMLPRNELRIAIIPIHELRLLPPHNNQEEYQRPGACCVLNEDRILGVASIPPGTQTSYPPPAVGLFLLITKKYGYSSLILATLMAGGILVVMGLARMGTLIKFIPWPVTNGFTTGIAVSIMAKVSSFIGSLAHSSLARRKRWRMPCNGLASCRECSFCDCIW